MFKKIKIFIQSQILSAKIKMGKAPRGRTEGFTNMQGNVNAKLIKGRTNETKK